MRNRESRRLSSAAMRWVSFLVVNWLAVCATAEVRIDFNRDVRPLLSDRCFHCHGPDENSREADLRLDESESALDSAIVPGDPDGSELIRRILSQDDDERMPPAEGGKPLTDAETAILKQWVKEGAVWSAHWAYVKPELRKVPGSVGNDGGADKWGTNWIDGFILSRLDEVGLQPSAKADAKTLVRRLSFDLTGLPPTRQQVRDFAGVTTRAEYEAVVDELLASPAFGERMAMYWLDLVRFADTVGYHGDQDHNVSPYRDYVISAFNRNMSFDQFTREQLAGDLIAGSTLEQKIASGYNRLLQTSHEGGVQAKEYLAIYAADRVRNVSNVWMGATVGCAQCHDHKYDPYTAKDFYALSAFFADIDDASHLKNGTNALPTRREPEIPVFTNAESQRLEALEAERKKVVASGATAESKERLKKIDAELKRIKAGASKSMITVALQSPRTTRILPRGDWLNESGPIVEPAIPEFLGMLETEGRATRLDLAEWLVDVENGDGLKTARVMANRFWYLMFGNGLATVMDDFGGQGEAPSHPELLDNLAIEFAGSGWDVKHMMKLIAMSRTYRQSSGRDTKMREADPANKWLAAQSSHRLPAEMVRDNALAISGLLEDKLGGPSVKPYQPVGYYQHLNFPTRKYKPHLDDRQWRRGVYVHWQRQYLHPMLKAFDAPSREECAARRPSSNTPLAALAMLNDPTFVEAARVLGERILAEGGASDRERLNYVMELSVARPPKSAEVSVLLGLLKQQKDYYGQHPKAAISLVREGIAEHRFQPEGPDGTAELAAWVVVARAVLNLDETLTRN